MTYATISKAVTPEETEAEKVRRLVSYLYKKPATVPDVVAFRIINPEAYRWLAEINEARYFLVVNGDTWSVSRKPPDDRCIACSHSGLEHTRHRLFPEGKWGQLHLGGAWRWCCTVCERCTGFALRDYTKEEEKP